MVQLPAPHPQPHAQLIYSHTEWVNGEKYPRKTKQNQTEINQYFSAGLAPSPQRGCWQALLPTQKLGREGTARAGSGRRTAPFQLPVTAQNQSHTKRTVKGGPQLSQGKSQCLQTEERALKAPIFLPDTSKSACVCCESPVCHAWGQLSME